MNVIGKIVFCIALLGLVMSAPLLNDQDEWTKFKAGYNKAYTSPEEENQRFEIFKDNLQRIREHNEKFARGEVTYTQGVNEFADLTHDEFRARYTGYRGKQQGK